MAAGQAELQLLIKARDTASTTMSRTRENIGKLGKTAVLAFGAAGVAAGAAGVLAVKGAIEFEKAMAEVATLMPGISKDSFGVLQQGVLDLSKELNLATSETVPALYQAISAGVPPENVLDFMRLASKAAIGGVTDLSTAVDGITSVVNSYGAEIVGAQKASDIMFTTVKLGKTDFQQLSNSLFNVIPTAATLGISFEEIGAQLAVITGQGVPTSVATTQLRAAFVEASKGGTLLNDAIKELHGKGFKDLIADGMTTTEIFQAVRDETIRNGTSFGDLFGSVEAMNAVLAVTGPNASKVQKALAEMANSAGAVDAAFNVMSETASFKFGRVINSLKIRLTELGLKLLPLVMRGFDMLSVAFGRVSVWFNANKSVIIDTINGIADAGRSLWSRFRRGLEVVIPLLVSFGKQSADTFGPLIEWVKRATPVVKAFITDAFGAVADWIRENGPKIVDFVSGVLGKVFDWFASALPVIKTFVTDAFGAVTGWISEHGPKIIGFVSGVLDRVKGWFLDAAPIVKDFVVNAFGIVAGWITENGPKILNFVSGVLDRVKDWFIDVIPVVKDFVINAFGAVTGWISEHGPAILDFVSGVLGNLLTWFVDGVMVIKDFVVNALDVFSNWFAENREGIMNTIQRIIDISIILAESFKTGFLEVIVPALKDFADVVIKTTFPVIKELFEFIIGNKVAMIAAITGIGIAIFLALGPGTQAIIAIVALITLIGFLRDNWDEIWSFIQEKFRQVSDFIVGFIDSKWFWLLPGGPLIKGISFICKNWREIWTKIKDFTSDTWDGILRIVKGGLNIYVSLFNKLIDMWNSLEFKVPKVSVGGISFGGFTIGTPKIAPIPVFRTGGIVPGALGSPQLILAHGGERITPGIGGGGIGGGGFTLIVNGDVIGLDDLAGFVVETIRDGKRRGQFQGVID